MMLELIAVMLVAMLKQAAKEMEQFSKVIFENIFKLEEFLTGFYVVSYESIYIGISFFVLGLLVVIYLKKGFEIYVLGSDGDASINPIVHLINFIKVVIIIVGFNSFFDVGIELIGMLTVKLFPIDFALTFTMGVINNSPTNIIVGILFIIIMIDVIKLFFQFIQRSIELFALRIGAPLAAIGILNSDKGIWSIYFRKFVQEMLTVVLQVFLLILSTTIVNNSQGNFFIMLVGLGALKTAVKLPQFLSDLIVIPAAAGTGMQKVHSALMISNSIKGLIKR